MGFFARFIDAGSLVFDVGSNIGDKAAVFLELGARVVAFEPQPACASTIRERFQGNPNIEVIEAGLADKAGELTMSVCTEATTLSTLAPDWKDGRFRASHWDREIVVPVITLDSAIERFGDPGYTKIDVEGFEERVLMGLSQKAGTLSFEFTREFSDKTARCLELLAKIGYRDFNIAVGEDATFISADWLPASEILEFIQGSEDELLWGDVYARA
jgi:FkbM family methyltransferase